MPAPFIPAGSSLSALHLPAALIEAMTEFAALEATQPLETRPNLVTVSATESDISVSATFPITVGFNTSGHPVLVAAPTYNPTFTPGTSVLKSDTYAEAIVELALLLRSAEKVALPEDRVEAVAIDFSADSVTVSLTGPASISTSPSGSVVMTATDYVV